MTDIYVGSVAVGVVPDARGWNQELRAQLVPSAAAVGAEVGSTISREITAKMGQAGTQSGGAFEDTFRKRVKAALDALPKDATGPIAELRAKLEELARTDIIDGDKAVKELVKIDTALKDVSKNAKDIRLTFDTKEARAQLALLRADIGREGSGGSGSGGILGGISGLFGGGAAAAGPTAQTAGGGAGFALSNPYVLTSAITAGLVALPFLAQIAAGAITAVLGGALAGLGIVGAIMTGKITKQFDAFKTSASNDLKSIGSSFVPVLQSILRTAQGVLKYLTPVFRAAAATIAGPFQLFANTILKAFMQPAVKKAIQDIAVAFTAVMKAFTPDIPGIAQSFAEAISRLARAVAANPKAFADFLNFFFQLIIVLVDALAWLTRFANYMEQRFIPAVGHFVNFWILAGHDIEASWNITWNNTIARANRGIHDVAVIFDNQRHQIAARMNQTRADITNYWNSIWNNTIGRAIRGVNDLVGIFGTIRGKVVSRLAGAGSWLVGIGESIIQGLLNGIDRAMAGVGGWLKAHVVDPIVNAVKHFFGISSPATIMIPVGANIMQGVIKGMLTSGANLGALVGRIFGGWPQALGSLVSKSLVNIAKLPAKALNALGAVAGKAGGIASSLWHKIFGGGGGGVNQWAGTVLQALSMLHLPMSLMGQVLYQMQTESGGNPNAINLTDINAQMGDPSRGLLQVIGATFSAFHVPGTSGNIYDPLANVAAAINYAMHRYGPSLISGGMGMGSGHGYDTGGWWPPGTFGWNTSGQHELVVTQDQLRQAALDGGATYHAHFDGLTGQAIEGHVRTAFQAMSVTQGNLQRQGRRR
jgi:Transglycosylase SLT domain